ncbi:MAG: chorismate synthase [Saprospiraceae bacterium]|nr:chorismate synthase [Saprospiraceae bacterium]MBK9728124.1 chorismate synthase [Saprospiraceae bacterium]
MNSFGNNFRISIYGESHGSCVGILVDGVPPGISIHLDDFIIDLERRKAGKPGMTTRVEEDTPIIKSGIFNGFTTGAPLNIQFANSDVKSKDYEKTRSIPRPGHADFVASKKYLGFNDYRGGGHFSGRLTLALVAAGVIAKKTLPDIQIHAELIEAGGLMNIEEAISNAILSKDSIGGIIECRVKNLPIGVGEPFFNSLESMISHLVFAIPAVKGIEFGSGFKAVKMKGSEHNDSILDAEGKTASNFSGGINGGISNGNDIVFRVAIKPTSSIQKKQTSLNINSESMEEFVIEGRHDVCIALRVPVIIEAATAIVLADLIKFLK